MNSLGRRVAKIEKKVVVASRANGINCHEDMVRARSDGQTKFDWNSTPYMRRLAKLLLQTEGDQ